MKTSGRAACTALLLALLATGAAAHDSWLEPAARAGDLRLVTGPHYPAAETSPAAASLTASGCVDGRGRARALKPVAGAPHPLVLRTRPAPALACWAELAPHDIELAPPLVAVYFREIQPPEAVRRAWAQQQERGIAWQERYRKSARIELTRGDETAQQLRALRQPRQLALEIVVDDDRPLQANRAIDFRVLADGQPVPDLALELVSARSPAGLWRRTDAQGRLRHTVPFAGTWALRGTLLQPEGDARWQSRFVTLVFQVR